MANKTQKTMTNYCIDGIIDSLDHCASFMCEGCRGQHNPNCVKELSEMARDAITQLREDKEDLKMMVKYLGGENNGKA